MNTFLVLSKEDDNGLITDVRFISEGFSFYALIFGPFWLIFHRLWSAFLLYILATILLYQMMVAEVVSPGFSDLLLLSILLVFAFNADNLIVNKLIKSGYSITDIIIAANEEEAEVRHITKEYKLHGIK